MTNTNVVQTWIDLVAYSHSKNASTAHQYKKDLQQFCEFMNKTPEQIIAEYQRSRNERRLRQFYTEGLRAFIAQLTGHGFASNTVSAIIAGVKSFFKYNDLGLGFIPFARGRVIYHNRDITIEEIRSILAASNPREKAFYCMMAQTGLRPDTLCKLQLKDIEPDYSRGIIPCKVDVPEEKAKGQYRSYFTFMGDESVKYLRAYLNGERPEIKSEDFLFTAYGSSRAASPKSISVLFAAKIRQLRASKVLDFKKGPVGKPSELRLYTLRKFFRKYAREAGFELVQFWMGHVVRIGVDDNYRPNDPEYHRALYRDKAMEHLRLETPSIDETGKVIVEQNKRIMQLQATMKKMQQKLYAKKLSPAQENIEIAEKNAEMWKTQADHMKDLLKKFIRGEKLTEEEVDDAFRETSDVN